MGDIKLTGLGYDAEPNYEDNLKGLNAGYLNYSKTSSLALSWILFHFLDCAAGNLKYHCGYSAHVILGETYQLDDIGNKDAHFELHDLYPEYDEKTAEIELDLCVGENCQTCVLTKEIRKWITHEGVDENAEQNDCGRVYNNLRDLSASIDV